MNPALDSRARFEAHRMSKDNGRRPQTWDVACVMLGLPKPRNAVVDNYVRSEDQAAWEAWQAAIASRAAPEGWQLVPVDLTEEMHESAVRTAIRCTGNADFPPRVWRAMLAAAPTPQDPPIAALAAKETPQ